MTVAFTALWVTVVVPLLADIKAEVLNVTAWENVPEGNGTLWENSTMWNGGWLNASGLQG